MAKVKISVKRKLREYRNKNKIIPVLEAEKKELRDELVPIVRELDPDKVGIVFDPEDPRKGAATWQQNEPSKTWDVEGVIEWLKENGKWETCSTQMFDQKKWESEVAAGNIPKSVIKGFVVEGDPPTPFLRLVPPTEDSIK